MDNNSRKTTRRRVLQGAGALALGSALGPATATGEDTMTDSNNIRWGVVGTGMIANMMAPNIGLAHNATLAAVSSRRITSAEEFAKKHGAPHAYDSWQEMIESDTIDAVYVATPTSVREEISIAAAQNGKHVLGEKPFASLDSLRRITAACRKHGVGFMDGTHFVHHPRTFEVRASLPERVGSPASLATTFQFYIDDTSNIRLNRSLEPLGAIGDVGWYNMRAAVEYLSPDVDIAEVSAHARHHPETGAVLAASGLVVFTDESTTTFHCGFDSGAVNIQLRLAGPLGEIAMENFAGDDSDGSASWTTRSGGFGGGSAETLKAGAKAGAVLMFEDFGKMTSDPAMFEASVAVSERTQGWLDAVFQAATGDSS